MDQKQVSDHCLTPGSGTGLSLKNALEIYLDDLRAALRPKGTIESKRVVLEQLVKYSEEHGWPSIDAITTRHLRSYLVSIRERPRWFGARGKAGPISTSYYETIYRRIKTFFNWLIAEGEIPPPAGMTRAENPMDRIPHPRLEEKVIPPVPDEDFSVLLELTDPARYHGAASKFRAIRNRAALWLLSDTSVRREGLTGLKVGDVDLEERCALVTEKGRKQRYVDFSLVTARCLRRYLMERDRFQPATDDLWVDANGDAMGPPWVHNMLKRLGQRAGIPNVHAHRFRHTFAVKSLEGGTPHDILEVQGGWKKIPATYTATIGRKQAREWHRRVAPADQLAKKLKKKW